MKVLHLFDLPRELRIKINDNYRAKIFELVYKRGISTKELSKVLKTREETIRRWKRGFVLPPLGYLVKLLNLIEFHSFVYSY